MEVAMTRHMRPHPNVATSESKTEKVYETIRQRILAGHYPEGHRLKLHPLADEFGTSPVPIREALQRLEADSLISIVRNKGAHVRPAADKEYEMTIATLAILEGACLSSTIPPLPPAILRELTTLTDGMEGALNAHDFAKFLELNDAFHARVIRLSPNTVLSQTALTHLERLEMMRHRVPDIDENRAQGAIAEHRQLLKLLRSEGHPSALEQAMRGHRMNSVRR